MQRLRGGLAAAILCVVLVVAGAHPAQAGINVWTSGGPEGKDVLALAIDAANPTTLYAGTLSRGVFKTPNAGGTWSAIGPSNWSAQSLAIDPASPSRVYAAGAFCDLGGCFGPGVFKSEDGGGSWVTTGFSDRPANALAIDPTTPMTLFAATGDCHPRACGGAVYKSTDGGDTWSDVLAGPYVHAIVIDPTTSTTLYAGTVGGSLTPGVVKSVDGGVSWTAANLGLPDGAISALVVHPAIPSMVYAGTEQAGAFKTTDGGATWVTTGFPRPFVGALAIDPVTPTTLYAGTDGVYKSSDGGTTWTMLNTGLPDKVSVWALAIDPTNPRKLFAGTFGGGVFDIEQIEPSPTPSATRIPTTRPSESEGGCTATPIHRAGSALWLLVPMLALLRARRQAPLSIWPRLQGEHAMSPFAPAPPTWPAPEPRRPS